MCGDTYAKLGVNHESLVPWLGEGFFIAKALPEKFFQEVLLWRRKKEFRT